MAPIDFKYTVASAAILLGVSQEAIRVMCRRGRVVARKNSDGKWVIQAASLETIVKTKRYTIKAVSKRTGFHPETLRKWLRAGVIAGEKNGGQWTLRMLSKGFILKHKGHLSTIHFIATLFIATLFLCMLMQYGGFT